MKYILLIFAWALGALILNAQAAATTPVAEVAAVAPAGGDAIVLVKQVHAFYDSAWSKLIWTLGSAFAIIGFVMPLVFTIYFWNKGKKIKKEQGKLTQLIKAQQEMEDRIDAAAHELCVRTQAAERKREQTELDLKREIDRLGNEANRNVDEITKAFEKRLGGKMVEVNGKIEEVNISLAVVKGLQNLTRGRELELDAAWGVATLCFLTAVLEFIRSKQEGLIEMGLKELIDDDVDSSILLMLESANFSDRHLYLNFLRVLECLRDDSHAGKWIVQAEKLELAFIAAQARKLPAGD
jgi:hypothetical protein